VDVLQKRNHIVGMTGDGVNDAPALKKADCGIAVSGATDAARAAAAIVLMTPGLSVIIDAIKESRRIFQRMNSYAIYRIAETLRVLFFMTLAILIFNFYPLTAVMIVMLALLNDGAILSIAYDNVHYKDQPESWNMRMVLGISTVLGVIGVVSAFGLFYLGERVFRLDRAHIQTLMYLKLSVAGHLTIFLTRTRGPFWSIRPAKILWLAVLGTQIVATMIAVYGLFMTPLGWGWAGFVWGYALLWFLLNDRVKLLAYRIFDPIKKAGAKPETKAESQPDAKGDAKTSAKPEAKAEPQSGAKEEQEPDVKTDAKDEAKPDARDEPKPEAKPEAKTEPKPDENAEPKPAAKAESKPETKAVDPKAEAKVEQKPDAQAEPKPQAKAAVEAKAKITSDLTPQIATRAYELYEQQGHRDGQSVQNWEKAEQEIRKDEIKAEPKPEAKDKPRPAARVEPKPETKVAPKPGAKPDTKPEATAEPKPAAKTEPAPEVKAPATPDPTAVPPSAVKLEPKPELKADAKPTANVEPKPDAKVESKPEPNAKPAAEVSPQLVKKVHNFYEQLGREDVRAVEESDQAKQKTPEEETKK
jgi:H+-transporting ATPase